MDISTGFFTSKTATESSSTRDHISKPRLIANFCAACKPVKDLPFQNGVHDWSNFEYLWQQLQRKFKSFDSLRKAVHERASTELKASPLFEILFKSNPPVEPPTTFASAKTLPWTLRSVGIKVHFTARAFVDVCKGVDIQYAQTMAFKKTNLSKRLTGMVRFLASEQINVLEFLSTEMTDQLLEDCPLLKLLIHTLEARSSHVIFSYSTVELETKRLNTFQGFMHMGSTMHVPPYPPNEVNGLRFDYAHFLKWIQDAEANIDGFDPQSPTVPESFDILHKNHHQLMFKNITVAEFMAGREPAEGTPGAIIYKHMINSGNDCWLFWYNVMTDGHGQAFLDAMNEPEQPKLLTKNEATRFVDTLVKVNIADIPGDSMRCSHCWCDFDEVQEGIDNTPVALPCDSRHIIGRDCLIENLVKTGPLCPLCRVDIVESGARAASESS